VTVQRVGAMWTVFFTDAPVRSWDDARGADTKAFARFHQGMLKRGVYLPPSQWEAAFHSVTHDDAVIDATLAAAAEAFREARG
jgi:glutamate-1-semialdehyde 2,1-aminomutase